jgi:hypothetical protein
MPGQARQQRTQQTSTPDVAANNNQQMPLRFGNAEMAAFLSGRQEVTASLGQWMAAGLPMQKGMKGPMVKELQNLVGTNPDGAWGPGTDARIAATRERVGLSGTGFDQGLYTKLTVRAASGPNAMLFQVGTKGASAPTARQDRLNVTGVEASEKLAAADIASIRPYMDAIRKVAKEEGVPPALVAAIVSRETRGGKRLDSRGWGLDDTHGFGLMQVDDRWQEELTGGAIDTSDASPGRGERHIRQATKELTTYRDRYVKNWSRSQYQDSSPAEQLRVALSVYNGGPSKAKKSNSDAGTTGQDYSSDTWARARYFAETVFKEGS